MVCRLSTAKPTDITEPIAKLITGGMGTPIRNSSGTGRTLGLVGVIRRESAANPRGSTPFQISNAATPPCNGRRCLAPGRKTCSETLARAFGNPGVAFVQSVGKSFPRAGFPPDRNTEKTNDQNENIMRRCCSFRRRYRAGVRSGCGRARAGKPPGYGAPAPVVSRQKLFSGSGFRAALSGMALWLEHR